MSALALAFFAVSGAAADTPWLRFDGASIEGASAGRVCAALGADGAALFMPDSKREGADPMLLRLADAVWLRAVPLDADHARVDDESGRRVGRLEWRDGHADVTLDMSDVDCALMQVRIVFGSQPSRVRDPELPARDAAAAAELAAAQTARVRGDVAGALAAFARAAPEALVTARLRARALLERAQLRFELFELDAARRDVALARTELALDGRQRDGLDLFAAHLEALFAMAANDFVPAARVRAELSGPLRERLGGEHEDTLANEVARASLVGYLGDAAAARASLERLMAKLERLPAAHPVRVVAVIRLANLESEAGEGARAQARLARALAEVIAQAGDHNFAHARLAARLGTTIAGARPVDAIAALRASALWHLSTLGADNLHTINARESLAYAEAALGRYDDAIVIQDALARVYTRRFGSDDARTLTARHNLARYELRSGRVARGIERLRELVRSLDRLGASEARRAIHVRLDLAIAVWDVDGAAASCTIADQATRIAGETPQLDDDMRSNVELVGATCAGAAGRHAEAVSRLRALVAARYAGEGPESYDTLTARAALAREHLRAGEAAAARSELETMVEVVEALRAREPPDAASGRTFFAEWVLSDARQAGYRDLARILAMQGETVQAIRVADAARARSVNDALGLRIAVGRVPDRERLQWSLRAAELREADAQIALLAPGAPERVALEVRRTMLRGALERLDASPPETASALDIEKVRAALAPATAAVGFQVTYDGVWAYVLRRDRPPVAVVLPAARPLLGAIASLRTSWMAERPELAPIWRTPEGAYETALTPPVDGAMRVPREALVSALARALFEPLAPHLRGLHSLVLLPEGALAQLPFEALVYEKVALARRYAISYAASLATREAAARDALRRPRPSLDVIAIGAPDYGRMRAGGPGPLAGLKWTPLPSASAEVAAIAHAFPPGRTHTVAGVAATKARFAAMARDGAFARTRILHVAAHGHLDAAYPQWSAIVLAGDGDEPGYVTAAELAALDIGSDLVVLSACDTALGKDVAGEGVFGLPHALAVAGARATLLTLWPVDDASATHFMRRFYARLARGETPVGALARTKRELGQDSRYSAPRHWAPYVLFGG